MRPGGISPAAMRFSVQSQTYGSMSLYRFTPRPQSAASFPSHEPRTDAPTPTAGCLLPASMPADSRQPAGRTGRTSEPRAHGSRGRDGVSCRTWFLPENCPRRRGVSAPGTRRETFRARVSLPQLPDRIARSSGPRILSASRPFVRSLAECAWEESNLRPTPSGLSRRRPHTFSGTCAFHGPRRHGPGCESRTSKAPKTVSRLRDARVTLAIVFLRRSHGLSIHSLTPVTVAAYAAGSPRMRMGY
jgi:hypothetical protein